jgi:hypothetical protein
MGGDLLGVEMKGENIEEKLPSVYDYFYYDCWIANSLCELNSFKNFLKKHEIIFENVYYGYLYLLELVIISLVNHVENLIEDVDVFELIHWGNVITGDKKLRELIREHLEVKFIFSLLNIRKSSSSQRFRGAYDEEEIICQLDNFKAILDKLNVSLIKKYDISKIEINKGKEVVLILNWILNKYNWIELDLDLLTDDETVPVPLFPNPPIFYLMPDNLTNSYYLQNPKIKSKEQNYLKGFSLALLYLYKKLIPERINKFEKDILNVNNWIELHKIGRAIRNKTVKNSELLVKLFDVNQEPKIIPPKKGKIDNYEELRLVLRGRKVRLITDRFPGDYPNTESLFLHVFFGAIQMFKINLLDKPEIIEFRQIHRGGNWIEYSYAIYIPVAGALWDASHWLVFDKLCVESSVEPNSFFKMMVNGYVEIFEKKSEENLFFHRFEIKRDLFRRYIEENDFETKAKKDQNAKFGDCKGLLGELLAGLYLIKEENVANLIRLDFHRDLESTDIDVIGETKDSIIISQVKTNLSFSSEEHEKILENFSKVVDSIEIKDKKVRKILFILNDHIPEAEINKLWEDEEIFKRCIITDYDIENKKQEGIRFFQTRNVKTLFLKDLKEKLKGEGQYSDLLNKLNLIFPESESGEDNE